MLRLYLFFFCVSVSLSFCFSQVNQSWVGYLKDDQRQAIKHGTITVHIRGYELGRDTLILLKPDQHGRFEITFPKPDITIMLEINCLGYENKNIKLDSSSDSPMEIILESRLTWIDEVRIDSRRGVHVGRDTIRYKVDVFSDNNENKVEELIAKLPGVHVDENGNIRHNNRPISRVMIEDDNLFEDRYKIITKNLSATVVDEVEIIDKYHPNPIFDGTSEGKETVLNLRLKNKNELIHSFNAQIGQSLPEGRHEYSGNYIGITSYMKGVVLASSNNVGKDPVNFMSGENDFIIRTNNTQLEAAVSPSLYQFDSYRYSRMHESRNNFNNAQLLSANFIFSPYKQLSIKPEISLVKDRKHQNLDNYIQILNVDEPTYYNESFAFKDTSLYLQTGLKVTWNISDSKRLEILSKYRQKSNRISNVGQLSDYPFKQNAYIDNRWMEHRLNYTQKIGNQLVWDSEWLYFKQNNPEELFVNPSFIFENLIENGLKSNIPTSIITSFPQTQLSFKNRLLKSKGSTQYELFAEHHYRKQNFNQLIFLEEENSLMHKLPMNYRQNKLGGNLRIDLDDHWKLSAQLDGGLQTIGVTPQSDSSWRSNDFIYASRLSLVYKSGVSSWSLSYLRSQNSPRILDLIQTYRVINYKLAQKGLDRVILHKNDMASLNYNVMDLTSSMFTLDLTVSVGNNSRAYLAHTDYIKYYQLTKLLEYEPLSSPYMSLSGKGEKYLGIFKGNLFLNLDYFQSKSFGIRNDVFNTSIYKNFSMDFGVKSAWDGLMNLQITARPQLSHLKISSRNNVESFDINYMESTASVYLKWNKRFNSQVISSLYILPDQKQQNSLYFLDFKTRYVFKKDKFFADFTATNILNEKSLTFTGFHSLQEETQTYRLIPNNYMVSVFYSF